MPLTTETQRDSKKKEEKSNRKGLRVAPALSISFLSFLLLSGDSCVSVVITLP